MMVHDNSMWIFLLCLLAIPACSGKTGNPGASPSTANDEPNEPDINAVLADSEAAKSTTLMQAANAAFSQDRFEEAAFLLYAGQIRLRADMEIYPPKGSGGDSPATAIGAVSFVVGAKVSPAIMRKRDAFSRVVKRLMKWSPKYEYDYSPGWQYRQAAPYDERRIIAAEVMTTSTKQMRDFNSLLANDEYDALYRRLQEASFDADFFRLVDGKDFDPFTPPSTAEIQIIRSRMQEIESELEIEGMFYKRPDKIQAEE